jgi:hypothetical protein
VYPVVESILWSDNDLVSKLQEVLNIKRPSLGVPHQEG